MLLVGVFGSFGLSRTQLVFRLNTFLFAAATFSALAELAN